MCLFNCLPVQVAHGDGREGHGGRRDERVGGDRRVLVVIVDYDDEASHGEEGTQQENRNPVECSEVSGLGKLLSKVNLVTVERVATVVLEM